MNLSNKTDFYVHLSSRDPDAKFDSARGFFHKVLPTSVHLPPTKNWYVSIEALMLPSHVYNVHQQNDEWHYCKITSNKFSDWTDHLIIFRLPHGRYTPVELANQFNASLRKAAKLRDITVHFRLEYLENEKRFIAHCKNEFIGTPPNLNGTQLLGLAPYDEREPFFPPPLWNPPDLDVSQHRRLPFAPQTNVPTLAVVSCNFVQNVRTVHGYQPWLLTFPWKETNSDSSSTWSPSLFNPDLKIVQVDQLKEIKLFFLDENQQPLVFSPNSDLLVSLRFSRNEPARGAN